jgi:hypothetical protein
MADSEFAFEPDPVIEVFMLRTIPVRAPDTTRDAERVQVALVKAAPLARRLRLALSLSATVIGAARRGLMRAHPHASARELDLRFVELHYGSELASGLRADLERRDRRDRREA